MLTKATGHSGTHTGRSQDTLTTKATYHHPQPTHTHIATAPAPTTSRFHTVKHSTTGWMTSRGAQDRTSSITLRATRAVALAVAERRTERSRQGEVAGTTPHGHTHNEITMRPRYTDRRAAPAHRYTHTSTSSHTSEFGKGKGGGLRAGLP